MIKFEKPEYKITEYIDDNHFGKFELEPLERGFGMTIGNALRRVMLSSLPGSKVTSVKIDGVMHEFQKIDGIMEDVTMIILNIKNLVVKNHTNENKTLKLSCSTEGDVTASMFEQDPDVEIINPDLKICTLVKGGKIDMEVTISNGRGYVEAKVNKELLGENKVGVIPVDSNFSPIENVKIDVLDTRVGQNENYDKLILEVTTDGSMTPEEAIALASKILVEHFELMCDLNAIANVSNIMEEKHEDTMTKTLETPIEEVEFSVRAYNCLKRHGVHTIQDLVDMTELEVTKIRNLGKKSLKEVIDKVSDLGLKFKE